MPASLLLEERPDTAQVLKANQNLTQSHMAKAPTNHISLLKVRTEVANHSSRRKPRVQVANHNPRLMARDQMVIKLTNHISQHMVKEVTAIKPVNHNRLKQKPVQAIHSLQHRVKVVLANHRRKKKQVIPKQSQQHRRKVKRQKVLVLHQRNNV